MRVKKFTNRDAARPKAAVRPEVRTEAEERVRREHSLPDGALVGVLTYGGRLYAEVKLPGSKVTRIVWAD